EQAASQDAMTDQVEERHPLHETRHSEEEALQRLLPREVAPALEALDARRVLKRDRPVRRHDMANPFVHLEAAHHDDDLLQPVPAAKPAPCSPHGFDPKTRW